jgi:hypothetical protein
MRQTEDLPLLDEVEEGAVDDGPEDGPESKKATKKLPNT